MKLLTVIPGDDAHPPAPIFLHPSVCDPSEVVPSFQYLESYVSNNCTLNVEISTRITKASQSYGLLNRILRHQRKIKSTTKLSIIVSVVLSTLLYGLETAVLLELQIDSLQSFVRSILEVSLWDEKKDNSIRKIAHLQRISTMLTQRHAPSIIGSHLAHG